MAKPEDRLWVWLRDVVLPLGQYSRIESETSPGFPDVHCQLAPLNTFTIELKSARNPNSKVPFTATKGMRRSQLIWIKENIEHGGTVWVIAEVFPVVYVIRGADAGKINGASKRGLEKISVVELNRSDPEKAAKLLGAILKIGIKI